MRRRRQRRHRLDPHPAAAKPVRFVRVVRHEPYRAHPDGREHPRRVAVVAQVGGQAQPEVRVDGVRAEVLLHVGAELVDQTDPTALLAGEIEHHPATLGRDRAQRFRRTVRQSSDLFFFEPTDVKIERPDRVRNQSGPNGSGTVKSCSLSSVSRNVLILVSLRPR